MIYFKRKSLIKKALNKILRIREIEFDFSFLFLKNVFLLFGLFLIILYSSYLLLFPKLITENNVENILNSYFLKNSKLIFDVDNLKVSPNYKFNLNLKADKVSLKYSKNSDFIVVQKLNADINLISLVFKNLDFDKINIDKIVVSTTFKGNKYGCFNYFSFKDLNVDNLDFKLRKLKIVANSFVLNIKDENINKNFTIKTNKIKLEKDENAIINNISTKIITKGNVYCLKNKLVDFNLNLTLKTKDDVLLRFQGLIEKLNYNPFLYADMYKFYAKADMDLKISPQNKSGQNSINGKINLSDMSFTVNGIKVPKNNILALFKGNKIVSDFDFNFVKNQRIEVKSIVDIGKFIELKLKSDEINLFELNDVIKSFLKILNAPNYVSDVDLAGVLRADVYLKSNFKKIYSKGKLTLKNGKISSKKLNLALNNVNSDIDLENSNIKFTKASAYFDNAKFNLAGSIDSNFNLNLKINSDLINMVQIVQLAKLLKINFVDFNDYIFKSGFVKLNSEITGTYKKPIIKSNSYAKNINLFIKSKKTSIAIQDVDLTPEIINSEFRALFVAIKNLKLKYDKYNVSSDKISLKIDKNDIDIAEFNCNIDGIIAQIKGKILNYSSKNPVADIDLKANLNKKNNLIVFKNQNLSLNSSILVKNDVLTIKKATLFNHQKTILNITGSIFDYLSNGPTLRQVKVLTNDKVGVMLPVLDNLSTEFSSNLEINGKITNPKLDGKLDIYNLKYPALNLSIKDALLNINNSTFYLNVQNGYIMGFDFDIVSQAKLAKNKLIVDYAQISSNYIDLTKAEKYLKNQNNALIENLEITSMKGNINSLAADEFMLNNFEFDGNYKNNILNVKKFSADIFNGKVGGNLTLNVVNQKVRADLVLKSLNVRALSNRLKQYSMAASGKLSALIGVDFVGFDFDEIVRTFDGYIKFNIDDGELSQFAKLERLLQAGNILSQSVLKLSLNSTLSAISKQNTGYFKTLEGTVKIKNSIANIQYIKVQGNNLSMYLTGNFNLLNNRADVTVLGRIPSTIVNMFGAVGSYTTEKLVDKMSDDAKDIIKSLTVSPFEKMLSTEIKEEDIRKIPPLIYQAAQTTTREFIVQIYGNINDRSSIRYFKWNKRN